MGFSTPFPIWRRRRFQGFICLCIVFDHLLYKLVTTALENKLICPAGNEVSFKCPCCPEEFDDCRFKKLFKGGYIVRDGALSNGDTKFKLSEDKTHITLKECHEDDEGTYVWMCGKSNVNRQFHLEVEGSAQNLTCTIGDGVAFESPCPDDFKTCTFRKFKGNEYIVRKGGILVNDLKYGLDAQNRVTLKECRKHDEGTYEWICGECSALSMLTVYWRHDHAEKQNHHLSRAGSSYCMIWLTVASSVITTVCQC